MEDALAHLKQLAIATDGVERQRLMSSLHKLAYSLETPDDTLHRYGAMNLQTASIKIGFDLRIFKFLTENESPRTLNEISAMASADAILTGRILRYLVAIGAIEEISHDQFTANHVTRNLAENVTEAGVSHYFETVSPQYQALPGFLKKTSYANPACDTRTVFQEAWDTELHAFSWFSSYPQNLKYFNDFMAFRREADLSWLRVYPVKERAEGWSSDRPLYVNIGGGVGHQCAQFKEHFPDIPGQVVLQDLPHSIAKALPTAGVQNMAHDFFEAQPIKGAKFYYIRGVLHNHPHDKVLKLLENTKAAMTEESVLLIDEMILPTMGAHVDAVSMDLTMMSAFAGMERTETQWSTLLDEAGLKLVKTYLYNPVSHENVMEVCLA
ncbi:S-adenosyl-L-methionine-dependent methyltransferase [Xylaria arbuscula]|nr:S-adenosyl-L-methionine-dependent methyltransferase [Xylaria arbuscula]